MVSKFIIENTSNNSYEAHPEIEEVLSSLNIKSELDIKGRFTEEQMRKLADIKAETERRKRTSPLSFYKPSCKKIEDFHKSDKKIRFLFGGNRSGKSTSSSIVEPLWLATGAHPYKKVRIPNAGWIVSLDFPTCRDVIEPEIKRWLGSGQIEKWDNVNRIIYLKNGSTIGFKSCDSGFEKFQGARRDWIAFDEEPNYAVYQECMMRTVDTGGLIFCAMTPTNGMSWTYDEIYEMAGVDENIWCTTVETNENRYLDQKDIEIISKMISEEEKDMRLKGKFIQFSGLIYKNFSKDVNVVTGSKDIKDWYKFIAIDPGINNPCAAVWIAMNRDCRVPEYYVYDDYYEPDFTIEDNSKNIVNKNGNEKIDGVIIDPWAGTQRNLKSGLCTFDEFNKALRKYSNNRLWLKRIQIYDKIAQVSKIRELLKVNEITNKPQLTISDNCYAVIKEICRYRYATQRASIDRNLTEKPQKVFDHTMNCIESLFSINPRPEMFIDNDVDVDIDNNWYGGR